MARTDDLDRLSRQWLEIAERIARRTRIEGLGWFSPTAWEMTQLDCQQAGELADEIKDLLSEVDAEGDLDGDA